MNLKCERCGVGYSKPKDYKKWAVESKNVFFKWSMKYCDVCRRKREREALKHLKKVMTTLSDKFECEE